MGVLELRFDTYSFIELFTLCNCTGAELGYNVSGNTTVFNLS